MNDSFHTEAASTSKGESRWSLWRSRLGGPWAGVLWENFCSPVGNKFLAVQSRLSHQCCDGQFLRANWLNQYTTYIHEMPGSAGTPSALTKICYGSHSRQLLGQYFDMDHGCFLPNPSVIPSFPSALNTSYIWYILIFWTCDLSIHNPKWEYIKFLKVASYIRMGIIKTMNFKSKSIIKCVNTFMEFRI
jgi:hypothetical protein